MGFLRSITPFTPYDYLGEEVGCALCGSTSTKTLCEADRRIKWLKTVICLNCGLHRTSPMPTEEELTAYYSSSYRFDYQFSRGDRPPKVHLKRSQRLAEQRYKRYKPLIPDGARVLDFGSGSGEFLNVCKNAGCDVLGIEPGMSYSNFARSEYSVDVISKSWTDVDLGDRKFDFISSFHVFEHLRDPKAALEFLLTHLYPDGAIVLEVPNMLPTQQKLFERLHFAHVHGFTPMSMTSLGASVGLIEDARVPSKSCDFAFRRAKKGEVLPPVENPAAASVLAETYDTASPVRHVLGFGWVIDAYHRVARDVREMAR